MTPIEAGETILQSIKYVLDTYPDNIERIKELEAQQTDLLHLLEFENITYPKGYKLATDLKEIRLKRRKYKDENEVLRTLYEYLNTGNSQSFIVNLTSNMGKARRRLEDREYTPRSELFKKNNEGRTPWPNQRESLKRIYSKRIG